MPDSSPFSWMPSLDNAIDRQPLTVAPTTTCFEAIALLDQANKQPRTLSHPLEPSDSEAEPIRSSCILVVQGKQLLGILTERDVVRLTARAVDLRRVTVAEIMVSPVMTISSEAAQDVFGVIFLFRRHRIRHMPIMDEQGALLGVVSQNSIRQILRPSNLLRTCRVADVMTPQALHAPGNTTMVDVVQLMATHGVSCIVITERDDKYNVTPVGIITERDIVRFRVAQIDLKATLAGQVMSNPLFLVTPEDSLWTVHQEMQRRQLGRMVVSWNWGQGLGIVTQTNLLRVFDPIETHGVIANLQRTIRELEAARLGQLLKADQALGKSPLLDQGARDRLQTALGQIYRTVRQVGLESTGQPRSQLQSVLEMLEQLQHDMGLGKI